MWYCILVVITDKQTRHSPRTIFLADKTKEYGKNGRLYLAHLMSHTKGMKATTERIQSRDKAEHIVSGKHTKSVVQNQDSLPQYQNEQLLIND